MKKKIIIIVIAIVLIVFISLLVGGALVLKKLFPIKKEVKGIAGYATYTSKEIDASFIYPKNWNDQPGVNNNESVQVWFQGPGTNNTPYRASLGIARRTLEYIRKDFNNAKNMKNLSDMHSYELKEQLDSVNYKVHFDKKIKVGGKEAFWFRYSSDDPDAIEAYGDLMNKSLAHTVWEEIIVQKGDSFYFIFWHYQGDEKYYDKYYEAFLKAKESFRFLDE